MIPAFEAPRRRRRPDLTPMIDVVFLLLVFFMLASRFASETAIPLAAAQGQGGKWRGPLRLVDLGPGGAVALNGVPLALGDLAAGLGPLVEGPEDPILVRGRDASLQELTATLEALRAAGFRRLVLVE